MEDLNKAIEGVLNDPQMMQKIMGMAQAFGGAGQEPAAEENGENEIPADFSQLQRIGSLLSQANIDKDQQNLLSALTPYMSGSHLSKLKRAMQAARLAELANSVMGPTLWGMGDSHV